MPWKLIHSYESMGCQEAFISVFIMTLLDMLCHLSALTFEAFYESEAWSCFDNLV